MLNSQYSVYSCCRQTNHSKLQHILYQVLDMQWFNNTTDVIYSFYISSDQAYIYITHMWTHASMSIFAPPGLKVDILGTEWVWTWYGQMPWSHMILLSWTPYVKHMLTQYMGPITDSTGLNGFGIRRGWNCHASLVFRLLNHFGPMWSPHLNAG